MLDKNTKYQPPENSCPKCGFKNRTDAHYCADCGFFQGEIPVREEDIRPQKPKSDVSRPEKKIIEDTPVVKRYVCPRCGSDIEGLERCQLCGLITPMSDEEPDEFLTDFMTRFPLLITNPGKFVDEQTYRLGWTAFIQPVLWTTLTFIIFWNVVFLTRGTDTITFFKGEVPLGSFIMISMALIVIVFPWILVLYILLLQIGAFAVKGRGRVERTGKAICSMLMGEFLLLGTLLSMMNLSTNYLPKYNEFLMDSPWHPYYQMIPFFIKILILLFEVFFLTIQVRILARVNYFEVGRAILAHFVVAVPIVIYFILRNYGFV